MMNDASMHNALIHEKSPYLLQHAENPVDWYPWGERAFLKAKNEDKPVFLSVGYATCHWCHVMAHESFEDPETARILNDHYVSIKVDREERPDLDKIYMAVCQALTGHGGWPLSVFLTPESVPFFAGTYFPKIGRQGLIGFPELLLKLDKLWKEDRERLLTAGNQITEHLRNAALADSGGKSLDVEVLNKAGIQLSRSFDPRWGGFGGAPKFPSLPINSPSFCAAMRGAKMRVIWRWWKKHFNPCVGAVFSTTSATVFTVTRWMRNGLPPISKKCFMIRRFWPWPTRKPTR